MKRKLWLILIPVLVTVICGTLSFLAGHYVPWTPLGTPPEPAVEILSADRARVIVHTATGSFYRCDHNISFPDDSLRGCIWAEIETAPTGPGIPEIDESCSYFLPPGRIVDRFYFCSIPHWRYVTLADGSVWVYYDDYDGLDSVIIGMQLSYCFPVGIAIGLLLGVTIYGLLRLRLRRQHGSAGHVSV